MKIVDLKDMPGFNPSVPNGTDSVSKGLVVMRMQSVGIRDISSVKRHPILTEFRAERPWCVKHGAMNRVSKDGIYRCLQEGCHVGCYYIP